MALRGSRRKTNNRPMSMLRPLAILPLLALAAPHGAFADFLLRDRTVEPSGDRGFELRHTPRPAIIVGPQSGALLPTPDGAGELVVPVGEPPDSRVESCLIYLPDAHRVLADVRLDVEPSEFSDTVRLDAVRIGTMAGLRVTVSPRTNDRIAIMLHLPPARMEKSLPTTTDPAALREARAFFLNARDVLEVPTRSGEGVAKGPPPPPSAPGDWRLEFNGEGLVSLDLVSIGATALDVPSLRLDHHGVAVPILDASGDSVVFYVDERVTAYNRADSVFATTGSLQPSGSIATRPAFDTLSPQGAEVSHRQTRRYEWNLHYQQIVVNQSADHFAFHVAANPPSSTALATYTYQLPFPDRLTSPTVETTVGLIAQNQNVTLSPDHYTDVVLSGVGLPRFSWEGNVIFQHTAAVEIEAQPVSPELEFTHAIPGVGENPVVDAGLRDAQRLDWVELAYDARVRAQDGSTAVMELDAAEVPEVGDPQPRLVTVGGFPIGTVAADVAVLDVTDPGLAVRLADPSVFADEDGTVAVEFEAPPAAVRFYVQLVDSAAAPSIGPASILPSLPSAPLTGIYVRPDEFDAALQPLVDHRGEGIVEFSPRQAYDVFGGGQHHPEAIRDAVRWYVENAAERTVRPALLLVGFGTLDSKDYLGLSVHPEVPSFIEQGVQTSPGWLQNGVDFFYACVEGDDELPDLRAARIPATNAGDLTIAIDRIIAHDEMAGAFDGMERSGVFLAGTDSAPFPANFKVDQPEWLAAWEQTGLPSVRIDDGSSSPDGQLEFDLFKAALETGAGGASYAQYMGHGFINNWQNNRMMNTNKVADIDTADRWPFVATYTCFNGLYNLPGSGTTSLAEAWLFFEPDRGAIAALAPVSVDFYETHREFTASVLAQLADPPETLGGWFAGAQTQYSITYPLFAKTLHEYVLFGDPDSPSALGGTTSSAIDYWMLE